MASENVENVTLEDVICICEDSFLKHLKFEDLKKLRLTKISIFNLCNKHINKHRRITVVSTHQNYDNLWHRDALQQITIPTLKASALLIRWSYADSSFLIVPNRFQNITKFLLDLHIGGDFDTLDAFLSQLPNVRYFGFSFSLLGRCSIDPNWWNTDCIYPNLRELEIVTNMFYPISYFNFAPLVRFMKRHPNISTLRTDFSLLVRIQHDMKSQNVKFENIYVNWDWYLSFEDNTFIESPLYYLKRWSTKKLYKNIYLQSDEGDVPLRAHAAWIKEKPFNYGLKQLRYVKSHQREQFETINILDSCAPLASVIYDDTCWFALRS